MFCFSALFKLFETKLQWKAMESEKKDQTLANVLEKNGLTDPFWIDKFKEHGIENSSQLKHANRKVFNQLSQHVKYP